MSTEGNVFATQPNPDGDISFTQYRNGEIGLGNGVVGERYTADGYDYWQRRRPDALPAAPPQGNTLGRVVGEFPVPEIPAGMANPPVEPETAEEESRWSGVLDVTQLALDAVGLIPVVGEVADGANALVSLARGDYAGAALSAAAMIPFAGWGATGAKLGRKGAKALTSSKGTGSAAGKAANQAGSSAQKSVPAGPSPPPKGKNGAKVKARKLKKHEVPCFNPRNKKFKSMNPQKQREYLTEYARQLRRQQDAINGMTATQFKEARNLFSSQKRNPAAAAAQSNMRAAYSSRIQKSINGSLRRKGVGARDAKTQAASRTAEVMQTLAALHEPDMVAGGWHQPEPSAMGRADVNSSIGGSWNQRSRLDGLDTAANDAMGSQNGDARMNVEMKPCPPGKK